MASHVDTSVTSKCDLEAFHGLRNIASSNGVLNDRVLAINWKKRDFEKFN